MTNNWDDNFARSIQPCFCIIFDTFSMSIHEWMQGGKGNCNESPCGWVLISLYGAEQPTASALGHPSVLDRGLVERLNYQEDRQMHLKRNLLLSFLAFMFLPSPPADFLPPSLPPLLEGVPPSLIILIIFFTSSSSSSQPVPSPPPPSPLCCDIRRCTAHSLEGCAVLPASPIIALLLLNTSMSVQPAVCSVL